MSSATTTAADPQTAYHELIGRAREQSILASCSALLGWDEQTYMPRLGSEHRCEQLALLAGIHHERATDPRIGELLGQLEGSELTSDPTAPSAVNIRELKRTYERLTRLPRTLVEELARVTSRAHPEWVEARRDQDFSRLQPTLETIVRLKREEASCLGSASGDPYDALLDEYEPGSRAADLATLFAALRRELVPLVSGIAGSSRQPDTTILHRDYPVDRQRMFAEAAAAALGFNFEAGRLDTTAHPFCTGIGPGDTRITTRFDARNFSDAFFGVLHEVGHGLYDQGLDPAHHGTPMGEAVSLGVHESQSRLWENVVGRSWAFWSYWFPLARQVFRDALTGVSFDAFYFAINEVKPSLIRVQADEVTYNLHILVRFELERALLNNDLDVADLPGAWNEAYTRYLGVTPANVSEGCLQDIHWSAGLFGYFPTYTLGNLFAAQLFEKATQDLGDLPAAIERGDYSTLLDWLRSRIHRHGQTYRSADLIERVTGSRPGHEPLMKALHAKYGALYGL
ncbi:MAG: carboxypeptidase M32 [Isosphaeraceae bacterium]